MLVILDKEAEFNFPPKKYSFFISLFLYTYYGYCETIQHLDYSFIYTLKFTSHQKMYWSLKSVWNLASAIASTVHRLWVAQLESFDIKKCNEALNNIVENPEDLLNVNTFM